MRSACHPSPYNCCAACCAHNFSLRWSYYLRITVTPASGYGGSMMKCRLPRMRDVLCVSFWRGLVKCSGRTRPVTLNVAAWEEEAAVYAQVPAGSLPRTMEVIFRNDIVEQARAGDKLVFCGNLIVVPDVSVITAPGQRNVMKGAGAAELYRLARHLHCFSSAPSCSNNPGGVAVSTSQPG